MSSFVIPKFSASSKRVKKTTLEDEKFKKVEGAISDLHSAVDKVSNVTEKHGLEALKKFLEMEGDGEKWLSDDEVIKVTKKFGENDYAAGSFLMLLRSKRDSVTRVHQWIRELAAN